MITFDSVQIKQNSAAQNAGFYTTNIKIYQDLHNYLNNITITGFRSYNNSSFMPKVGSNLIKWAWSKLYPICEKPITLTATAFSFSTDQLADPAIIEAYDHISHASVNPDTQYITIILIRKGMGFFDKMHERHPDKHIPAIETLLTEDRYHRLSVYRSHPNRIVILTNKIDYTHTPKLIGLLPALFLDAYSDLLNNESTKTLLEALFEANGDKLYTILQEDLKAIDDIRRTKQLKQFVTLTQDYLGNSEKNIQNQIAQVREKITRLIEELKHSQDEEQDLMWTLTGMHLDPEMNNSSSELENFLLKNKNITFDPDMGGSYAIIGITTPIMNYVVKDVEAYFKHPDRTTYLNNPAWFAQLIKDTFIEEKYRVITTTFIRIKWGGAIDGLSNRNGCYGNPHISRANCFASTKNTCYKLMKKGDMIGIINALTSACATLVFTDSTIISRFASELKEEFHNHTILQNTATGEMISPAEYKTQFTKTM
jgi:hypothetical protein